MFITDKTSSVKSSYLTAFFHHESIESSQMVLASFEWGLSHTEARGHREGREMAHAI